MLQLTLSMIIDFFVQYIFKIKIFILLSFFRTDKLYFADALKDRIESTDLNGQNRHTVLEHATHPFGLTVV